MRILLFATLVVFSLLACKSDKKADSSTTAPTGTTEKTPVVPVSKKYTLTPFSASPEFPNAKIDAMSYKKGTFDFKISGDYELGAQTPDAGIKMCANSAKGQHIHLIVDKAPYAAKYVSSFAHDVPDGPHYTLAFLSRSYHESIKTAGASKVVYADFKGGTMINSSPVEEPILFYSRPKGTYVGKANTDKVMLDFFVANANLGSEYSVLADINGEQHIINKWEPYYIEGLPIGQNIITLTLLKSGSVVGGYWNKIERRFTLEADPAES